MTSFDLAARCAFALTHPALRSAMTERTTILLEATGRADVTGSTVARLAAVIGDYSVSDLWLTFAIVHAELPPPHLVRRLRRVRELDGPFAAVQFLIENLPDTRRRDPVPTVSVVGVGTVLMDVTGLLPGDLVSEGRGAGRRFARAWNPLSSVLPVTWSASRRALRALTADEARSLGIEPKVPPVGDVVVPNGATYVLLGTIDKPRSSERLIALGAVSGNATASIGYGLRQLIGSEAYERQMGEERFSWHVAAQRSLQHLAVIGDSVIEQYRGWERMLPAIGLTGPTLHAFSYSETGSEVPDAEWQLLARSVGSAIGIH